MLPNTFLLTINRAIHVSAEIILGAIIIEVDLPKTTYCAYNTSEDNFLHDNIEFYLTHNTNSLQLCQLQIME
jgi:hypothetical protein